MISVTQQSSYRANAPTGLDNLSISHGAIVRTLRTQVNVEKVRPLVDHAFMAKTMGEKLAAIRAQSGLSLEKLAKASGYKGRSSIQRMFEPEYDPPYLSRDLAENLAKGFDGTGVNRGDIMALAGIPATNAAVQKFEGGSGVTLPHNLPIYGTALGAPREFNGHAVEQTTLNQGEIIDYARRPTVLNGQVGAYGLYVQGESMFPRFNDGDLIFVSSGGRPPRIGDDVVVYMRDQEDDDGKRASGVLVKRLARRTADFYELQQFNPDISFKIEARRVVKVDRVIPWGELLS